MNRKEFCEYFEIPYRTVVDWEAGKRKMPDYVFRLMQYKALAENVISETSEKQTVGGVELRGVILW